MDNSNPQDMQVLVQELQLSRNQIQTVSTQINEISLTLESLSKDTFESHLQRMVERENELRSQYDSIVSSME